MAAAAVISTTVATHQRPVPLPLKLPLRSLPSFAYYSKSPLPSPFFTPSSAATPKPRTKPHEAPAWISLLLQTLSLYTVYSFFSSTTVASSSSSSSIIPFVFLLHFSSAIAYIFLPQHHHHYRRSAAALLKPSQWALLFINGLLLLVASFLKFTAIQSSGPLIAVLSEYGGFMVAKLFMEYSFRSDKRFFSQIIRGVIAIAVSLLLLSQGWTIEPCSPLSIRNTPSSSSSFTTSTDKCSINFGIVAPIASGIFSAVAKALTVRTSLKGIPKRRVRGISVICGVLVMLPLVVIEWDSLLLFHRSALWPLMSMMVLGLVTSTAGDIYFEDKLLILPNSLKHFAITACCLCIVELSFASNISLVGFVLCTSLLAFGIRELTLCDDGLSWESIAAHHQEASTSMMMSFLIKGPLQHMVSDKKMRKIGVFLLMNTAFMFVEFTYGMMGNSLGLISDACHMLFDCAALAIGLYASYISKLEPNSKFNYGYGRFEVLSGYANAVFLVLVAALIVLESIERILDPPHISTLDSLLAVSVGGLLVNVVGLIFFHDEHHHAHGGGSCSHHHQHQQHHHGHDHGHGENCSHEHHEQKGQEHERVEWDHHGHSEVDHHQHAESEHHHHHGHDDDGHHHDHHGNSELDHHPDHSHGHGHGHDHQHHGCTHHLHPELDDGHHHVHTGFSVQHHHGHGLHETHENHVLLEDGHDDGHHHGHTECSFQHHHGHDNDEAHENHVVLEYGHDDEDDDDHIDHNMQGIFLHVLADTLGSVGVVISTLLIKYKGWMMTDPACSIFISAMIIGSVVPLLRKSGEILIQRRPRGRVEKMKENMMKRMKEQVEGVCGFERLHLWSLTNTHIVASLHLHAAPAADKNNIRTQVTRLFSTVGVSDITIQVEDI